MLNESIPIPLKGLSDEPEPTISGLTEQLRLAQAEIELLKAEIKKTKETANRESAIDLISQLNSIESRFALDGLIKNIQILDKARDEGKSFTPLGTSALFSTAKNIVMILKKMGIQPIETSKVGEIFELTDDNIDSYQVDGKDLVPGESKMVELTGPGWKYNDYIISPPRVKKAS